MSHKNKQTLRSQANEKFKKLFTPGESKHDLKLQARADFRTHEEQYKAAGMNEKQVVDSALSTRIFSYNTYDTYMKHVGYFVDFCKENYHCRTLEQCREHADEWLKQRTEIEQLSPYTLKLEAAALAKLYGEPSTNFYKTPERNRDNITRSRGRAVRDYGFNESKHADIVNFCRGTGLRRSELESLTGSQLVQDDSGGYYLAIKGKGGRERLAPIVGEHAAEIVAKVQAAGSGKVWDSVPSHMDVHSYRSQYASAIYAAKARTGGKIPAADRYYCRGSKKGTLLDKKALREASEALGHSRVSVVAEHYIR